MAVGSRGSVVREESCEVEEEKSYTKTRSDGGALTRQAFPSDKSAVIRARGHFVRRASGPP